VQLYRHFDGEGRLLYVGISLSSVARLGQHKHNAHWYDAIRRVEVEHFDDPDAARAAERAAIQTENPLFNLHRFPIKHSISKAQSVIPIEKRGRGRPRGAIDRKPRQHGPRGPSFSSAPGVEFYEWRRRLRLTQTEAARALGRSRRQVQGYDTGEEELPRIVCFAMIAIEDHPELIHADDETDAPAEAA